MSKTQIEIKCDKCDRPIGDTFYSGAPRNTSGLCNICWRGQFSGDGADDDIKTITEALSQTPKQALDAAIFAAVEQFEEATGCKVESAEYSCGNPYEHRNVLVRSK